MRDSLSGYDPNVNALLYYGNPGLWFRPAVTNPDGLVDPLRHSPIK
jgi:hypothetical protein